MLTPNSINFTVIGSGAGDLSTGHLLRQQVTYEGQFGKRINFTVSGVYSINEALEGISAPSAISELELNIQMYATRWLQSWSGLSVDISAIGLVVSR
jgi:hypothetical protein